GGGGVMTINQATAESVNCAFVRLSTSVGLEKVIDMAQKLGMRSIVGGRQPVNEWRVLTFTLGVISITPLEMANITATIAGDGVHHDPIFVSKVVEADGRVLFDEAGRPGTPALDPHGGHCEVGIPPSPLPGRPGTPPASSATRCSAARLTSPPRRRPPRPTRRHRRPHLHPTPSPGPGPGPEAAATAEAIAAVAATRGRSGARLPY